MELLPPQQAKADQVRRSCFQVLDLGLVLESDSESFRRLFCRDYFRFETPHPGSGRSLRITYLVRRGDPVLSIDGHSTSLQGHPNPDSCAYLLVLEALYAKLDGFIVLHAGVVEKKGRALIVAGARGSGKSTLVLGLLEQGYTFFSDDICPLGESTGLVHPFPRSPWARPSAAAARGVSPHRLELPAGKIPVDIESLGARIGRSPARPACIFLLGPHRPEPPSVDLVIAPKDGRATALFSKLGSMEMEGVSLEPFRPGGSEAAGGRLGGNGPAGNNTPGKSRRVWRLRYPRGKGLTRRIRDLLAEHDDRLWDVFREDAVHRDFSNKPGITAMTAHQAAFLLLRGLKHNDSLRPGAAGPRPARPDSLRPGAAGHRPARPGRTKSPRPPGEIFFTLCRMLGGIPCHGLRPGRLKEMLRIVTRTFEAAP